MSAPMNDREVVDRHLELMRRMHGRPAAAATAGDIAEFLQVEYRRSVDTFMDLFGLLCAEETKTLFGLPFDAQTRTEAIRLFHAWKADHENQRAIRKGARSPEAK